MQDAECRTLDEGAFLFPSSSMPAYVPNPPLGPDPSILPPVARHAQVAMIAPKFSDIGTRLPMIGFDFRKRQYIGV